MFEKHYRTANNAIKASKKQKDELLIKMRTGEKRTFWGLPPKAVYTTAICLVIVVIAAFLLPRIPEQKLPIDHSKPTESAAQKETVPGERPEPPTEGRTDPIEPSQSGHSSFSPNPGGTDIFTTGTGKVTDASRNPVKPTVPDKPEPPTKAPDYPPTDPPQPPPTDPPEPPPTEPEPGPEPTDPWEPPTETEPSTDDPTAAPPPTDPTEPTMPTVPTEPTEPSTEEPAEPAGLLQ